MNSALRWTPDLIDAAMQTARRFTNEALRTSTLREDQAIDDEHAARIVLAAREAGLLGGGEGLGLWSNRDEAPAMRLSLQMLTTIARSRTGVAYHLHRLALGEAICGVLGFDGNGVLPLIDLESHHESAALARLFDLRPPASAAACLPPMETASTRIVHAASPWQAIVVPVLERSNMRARLSWSYVPRGALVVGDAGPVHGLDDAPAVQLSLGDKPRARVAGVDDETSLSLLRSAVGIDALACVALALGALRRGIAIARAYAVDRKQGGVAIASHAAVQQLIGRATAVQTTVAAALEAAGPAAQTPHQLAAQLALRATLLPMMADASNAALQVMGGAGYMRDSGVEACVRDINHLRCVGGSSDRLAQLIAKLEELDP